MREMHTKPQGATTTYLPEWLKPKIATTPTAGEDAEKPDHSFFVGTNVNSYSHGEVRAVSYKAKLQSENSALVL